MKIEQYLEAILFYKGEPVEIATLAKLLSKTHAEIEEGITRLEENLAGRGLSVMRDNDRVLLATSKEAGSIIEGLIKEELERDLGKAALETLAIVLYSGPIPRSRIDYIRGVNSQFILRNLLIRGLVERIENPADQRSFLYRPSFELLAHLGVRKVEEMPEYKEVQKELSKTSPEEGVEDNPPKP